MVKNIFQLCIIYFKFIQMHFIKFTDIICFTEFMLSRIRAVPIWLRTGTYRYSAERYAYRIGRSRIGRIAVFYFILKNSQNVEQLNQICEFTLISSSTMLTQLISGIPYSIYRHQQCQLMLDNEFDSNIQILSSRLLLTYKLYYATI